MPWVKELASGTFHEVPDAKAVHAAYPGAYEDAKAGEVTKSKVGFGSPKPGEWADGEPGEDTTAPAPETPIQNPPPAGDDS